MAFPNSTLRAATFNNSTPGCGITPGPTRSTLEGHPDQGGQHLLAPIGS
jgi:hypothetical protein